MHTTLIVARMDPTSAGDVSRLFTDFDTTDLPHLMGTRRRQLFSYRGLYFHLQDFDDADGGERIEEAKADPRFVAISDDLKPFIQAYDPATWRSPADAMAHRFYHWQARS
ncbi:TcmI family type II polyketide cyclase [Streptomyces noursei]|uniref:TcmI family type II polyketide cyclase n=1 Tax=Streptomyces noursei TaxID=1971 RepID=UPI0033321E93